MPVVYCHSCQAQFGVPASTGECPACGGGFVEEVPVSQVQQAHHLVPFSQLARPEGWLVGQRPGMDTQPSGSQHLPRCLMQSSSDGFAKFMPPPAWHAHLQERPAGPAGGGASGGGRAYTRTFTLPGGGRGTVYMSSSSMPGMGGGDPLGGLHGVHGMDPFVNEVLEAMLGGGFLHPGMAGARGFGAPHAGGGPFAG